MKFVIRDDDLNFFSKPTDIQRWYEDIFSKNIPVGFSTIPFVKSVSDVYTAGSTSDANEYPVSTNFELVSYVKNNSLIEILQHGTTHETKEGIFEYQQKIDLSQEALRGKLELEKAFGNHVRIFVPPHDWIESNGVLAVEKARLNIIRGRGAGLRNWIPRWSYVVIFFKILFFKLQHMLLGFIPAYPYVLNFGAHKEVCSYRLEDTDVFEGLAYAYSKNGVFVVVTHLHFFTDEKKERLLNLIAQAETYNAEFVLPHTLFT